MQISSSVGQPKAFGPQSTSTLNNKPNTPIKDSVRSVAPEIEKEQASSKQATPSIVVDEQAIALFEQNQALASNQPSQSSNNAFSFDKSSVSQDQPSAKNETAVASYQAVGNLAQRESVQKAFGVDLFA